MIHLTRLGYTYISRKEHFKRNEETNIFPELFKAAILKINPTVSINDAEKLMEELILKLDYDDLGKENITINLKENQQLASLRDWLLPMLMNGQVKVGETKEYNLPNETLSMVAEGE